MARMLNKSLEDRKYQVDLERKRFYLNRRQDT